MKITYEFELNDLGEGMKEFNVFERVGFKENELLSIELNSGEVEDLQSVLKEATK